MLRRALFGCLLLAATVFVVPSAPPARAQDGSIRVVSDGTERYSYVEEPGWETLGFDDPQAVMAAFDEWLKKQAGKRLFFISDNNGFDWQFINWYFHG